MLKIRKKAFFLPKSRRKFNLLENYVSKKIELGNTDKWVDLFRPLFPRRKYFFFKIFKKGIKKGDYLVRLNGLIFPPQPARTEGVKNITYFLGEILDGKVFPVIQ